MEPQDWVRLVPDNDGAPSAQGQWLRDPVTGERFFAMSEGELRNPPTRPMPAQPSRFEGDEFSNQPRRAPEMGYGQRPGDQGYTNPSYQEPLHPGIQPNQNQGYGGPPQPMSQEQGFHQPPPGSDRQPRQRQGPRGGSYVQQAAFALIPAIGSMVAFMVFLTIRLRMADLQTMVAQGVNSKQAKDITKLFPSDQVSALGIGNMPEGVHVLTGMYALVGFVILFSPAIYMLARLRWFGALFYVALLVGMAMLVNLMVSSNFMDVVGMFPPLLSVNPLDLFGYLQHR